MSYQAEYEQHVFHSGTDRSYEKFLEDNAHRIVSSERSVAGDRVIVYCRPETHGESVIFVSGHFFGGM